MLFHDLKQRFRTHSAHKGILEKMGFPENWERIGRIKIYKKRNTISDNKIEQDIFVEKMLSEIVRGIFFNG